MPSWASMTKVSDAVDPVARTSCRFVRSWPRSEGAPSAAGNRAALVGRDVCQDGWFRRNRHVGRGAPGLSPTEARLATRKARAQDTVATTASQAMRARGVVAQRDRVERRCPNLPCGLHRAFCAVTFSRRLAESSPSPQAPLSPSRVCGSVCSPSAPSSGLRR